MIFTKNEIVISLWNSKVRFHETKPQFVSGRSFHSLSFRLSGEVTFEIDGKRYTSKENGITFMPAGVDYTTQCRRGGEMLIVHFKTKDRMAEGEPAFINNRIDLKSHFEELCNKPHSIGENTYSCMSRFYAILDALSKSQHTPPRRILLAKHKIDTKFSQKINIAELAEEIGVSEVHFRKQFKQCFGVSPLTYLKQVRVENAKQLLRSGYYSVTDAALECGYESISYFSYDFKRVTGVTPTQFING